MAVTVSYSWNVLASNSTINFITAGNQSADSLAVLSDGSFVAGLFGGVPSPSYTPTYITPPVENPVPRFAGSRGELGDMAVDLNYLYICVAKNTWRRVALSSWP